MDCRTIRLTIRGRVQGVGYRAWAIEQARRLALRGWARNRFDGSVEILVIGPGEALKHLVEACRRGPSHATVTSVVEAAAEDDGSVGFDIRQTG